LRNLPALLLALLMVAAVLRRPLSAENYLAWICFLPIGLSGIWAAFFHLIMPQVAARMIGWEVSPFQFEVGVADFAIGAAVVIVASIFLLGDAFGHVRQTIVAGNFAPGQYGRALHHRRARAAVLIALLFAAAGALGAQLSSARKSEDAPRKALDLMLRAGRNRVMQPRMRQAK
jgi:hypothetical protein